MKNNYIDTDAVATLMHDLKSCGFKTVVSVRPVGKIYLKIDAHIGNQAVPVLIKEHFPDARITSGTPSHSTFRLNP